LSVNIHRVPSQSHFTHVSAWTETVLSARFKEKEEVAMWNRRNVVAAAAMLIAAGAAWQAKNFAEENNASGTGVVTVFDHTKLEAGFADALANGGTAPLWSQRSSYGLTNVSVHSRDEAKSPCPAQGCSHKRYTAVVIVTSGAATLVVGGATKAAAPDRFGGQLVQGGQSHRIGQGDVFIMPPDTMHWYRDVAAPFRYIEVPVP
jgi:mannose-6-phosphate isomerase-like protein (cupin superfamily)